MGRFSLKKPRVEPTSWYLMELLSTDPVEYRCLKAHFKSRQRAIAAMHDFYNAFRGISARELEVWDDPSYSRWFYARDSAFGEGLYGLE